MDFILGGPWKSVGKIKPDVWVVHHLKQRAKGKTVVRYSDVRRNMYFDFLDPGQRS